MAAHAGAYDSWRMAGATRRAHDRKEMKTLAALASLILLFLTAQSPAKILVYKGTSTTRTGPVDIRPSPVKFFVLLDPDAQRIAFVTFFESDGKKLFQVGSPTEVQLASADILQGKTSTPVSIDTSETPDLPSFTNGLFYVRGIDATLNVASSGLTTSNQPRFFKGINLQTGISQGVSFFIEQKIAFSYQEERSIQANDANLSMTEVGEQLGQELRTKGFQD